MHDSFSLALGSQVARGSGNTHILGLGIPVPVYLTLRCDVLRELSVSPLQSVQSLSLAPEPQHLRSPTWDQCTRPLFVFSIGPLRTALGHLISQVVLDGRHVCGRILRMVL